jgi:hypothetical protein
MNFRKWWAVSLLLCHLKVWFILKSDGIIPITNHWDLMRKIMCYTFISNSHSVLSYDLLGLLIPFRLGLRILERTSGTTLVP